MTDDTAIAPIDAIREQIEGMLENAQSLEIRTPAHYEASQQILVRLAGHMKALEKERKAEVEPLNNQVKEINARYKAVAAIADPIEQALRIKGAEFRREQARLAAAQQAKFLEEQRRKQEALEKKATDLEARGKLEQAEAKREQAETMPVPVVAPAIPKVEGVSTRKVWKWEVTDAAQIPPAYYTLDETAISRTVRAQGALAAKTIPGIRVWEEETTVVRS